MTLLAAHLEVFAVDLRGQGRSSRTPGRYALDNMGNDLVRFLDGAIGRPAIVSGLSSGGVLAAWLSAHAKPGQVIGALYEDPPRPAISSARSPTRRPRACARRSSPRAAASNTSRSRPWATRCTARIPGSSPTHSRAGL